ncbi:MAG TPA: SDR family NAD(P)-dependent oxidoreductase [Candidatus Binataceae bacterium]|nr:SDR family NAD(P)-dependent oxidoreductase [Candidatus Binataceae bacterium]
MYESLNGGAGCIAIIGMAGRFPGARDIDEFWRNLREGVESILRPSDAQLRAAGVDGAELENPAYVKAVSVLDDIDLFDAAFFSLSPKDAAIMDPQHRFFLECAWHALENAGWAPEQFDGRIGVYAGSGLNTYLIHNLLANRKLVEETGLFALKQTGNDKDVLATRVSYQLNLTGPSLTVQTACSTSLVAVHLASQALLAGECDMALAGGVAIEIPRGRGYLYREGEILSRDGHCRPFDADSSGTIFGSGAGIVVLRRLEDAVRDGDAISAVIRGTAINNDGSRKVGFLAPSVAGQAEVIAEALATADVSADSISYIEAHGTGTRVGDPIEIEALARAFRASSARRGFCAIGSLKSNVGHLDAAAGVAGLIKTTLALKNREIPATVNFRKPNPLIDFAASPFWVAAERTEWKSETGARRAGVTSLGIGGTNAHAVLEEAEPPEPSDLPRHAELLTISAKTQTALDAMSRNLADHLESGHPHLGDVAFTTHLGRSALAHRRAIVCSNAEDAAAKLRRADDMVITRTAGEGELPVVFLFPGQGAQYAGMARELYEAAPDFRALVDRSCEFLRPYLDLDLRDVMFGQSEGADAGRLLTETRLTQPALFVIEYALAEMLTSLGIQPSAMIGHSVGEFAAACLAGVFSLEDMLRIVAERGRLMQEVPGGVMTAIAASERQVVPLLDNRCALASVNAGDQCVAAGPAGAVEALEAELASRKIRYRRLQVSHAFHSPMMDPIVDTFAAFVAKFPSHPATIRWVSSATGGWIGASEALQPDYWARQLRGTVRFAAGASTLLRAGASTFIEVGPGRTLSALVEQHLEFPSHGQTVSTLTGSRENVPADDSFQRALGTLWASGAKIDWRRYHDRERRHRIALPGYPFEWRAHWIDPDPQIVAAPSQKKSPAPARDAEGVQLFHPVWKEVALPSASEASNSATVPWLIFADREGLGDAAAMLLRRRGEQATVVRAGDTFERRNDNEFQIVADARDDYDRVLNALNSEGRRPRRILHLWSIVPFAAPEAELDQLASTTTASYASLVFLAQALAPELDPAQDILLAIASNNLTSPEGELIERPARAMLAGPCGVIPKELPPLQCRQIDVAMPSGASASNGNRSRALAELARQIMGEIETEDGHSQVAYRRGRRFVRTHEALTHTLSRLELCEGGVHLITGGLGGIGLAIANAIAESSKARLVLLSRRPLPQRSEWSCLIANGGAWSAALTKIETIERLGAEVMTISADVTDERSMRAALDAIHARFGAVTGIVHAAGTLADAPLLTKPSAGADTVLAPKVRGTLVLERVLSGEPLEYFILCSSVSSIIAPPGQVDYAAANAFLDAFAQPRSSTASYPLIALQFPRWTDVGMAADATFKSAAAGANEMTLDLARDWIVGEHRSRTGVGIFPGTGYIEIILNLARGLLPGRSIAIHELQFWRPLEVAPGQTRRVRTALRPNGAEYEFVASAATSDGFSECAFARISTVESNGSDAKDLASVRRRCAERTMVFAHRQNRVQEAFFNFGPRWNALAQIDFGRGEALATVELASEFRSDLAQHTVHPSLLDMATGAALFLIPGYETTPRAYVPMSYGKVRVLRPLPTQCYSHLRLRGDASADDPIATFDADVFDEQGNLLIEIRKFCMRQITDSVRLSADKLPHPAQPEYNRSANDSVAMRDSISAAEGVAAFRRILEGSYAANVVVFPSDFVAFERAAQPRRETSRASSTESSAAMGGEIETRIAGWWCELLGADALTPQSDFFSMGGQSLTAVRLFAKIRKAYGVQLSPATIYEARTIEELARRIARGATPAPHGKSITLVPIRTTGAAAPLYVFPDMNGTVIGFDTLVRFLPPEWPVYGAESTWLASEKVPLTLEEMAKRHAEGIRATQKHGPYFLLGYSFGGLMAFEVAQQLVEAGETIGMLGMLDTWQSGHIRRLEQVNSTGQKIARRARKALVHMSRLAGGPDRIRYFQTYVIARLSRQLGSWIFGAILPSYLRSGRPLPRALRRPADINMFAAGQYLAKSYPGRITLFRAAHGIALDDPRYGEALGWQNFAQGGVEIREVPGTHQDMLQEPNVQLVAEHLAAVGTRSKPEPYLEASLNLPVTEESDTKSMRSALRARYQSAR